MQTVQIKVIRQHLLRWYRKRGRDLPWRRTRDPYAILVSEVMLQQTQVDRVILKYRSFLKRWPTVRGLARAQRSEVIRFWSGLGYNRRAVHLHQAAQMIVSQHRGRVPRDVDALESLPGLGHYTARAVAAFAYRSREPFIDTNIRRILGRVFAGKHFAAIADDQHLLDIAGKFVPSQTPDLWHHALMDLGAMVCKPAPRCAECPLRLMCRSYPAILDHPQTRTPRRTEKFEDSDRYWRGYILRVLARPHRGRGVGLAALHRELAGLPVLRLRKFLAALTRDGLVSQNQRSRVFGLAGEPD